MTMESIASHILFGTPLNDPYFKAHDGITTGDMHSTTAIGLLCKDRTFIAEATLAGHEVPVAARAIVAKWQADRWNKSAR